MLKSIALLIAVLLCAPTAALANADFEQRFIQTNGAVNAQEEALLEVDSEAAAIFLSIGADDLDKLWRTGTGIVLLGSAENNWTRATAQLLYEVCVQNGIGLVRYAAPDVWTGGKMEARVRSYTARHGTSFANVYGSDALIGDICDRNAPLEGVALFINKGTLVGVQVGTAPNAQTPDADFEAERSAVFEDILELIHILGTSPCPGYC